VDCPARICGLTSSLNVAADSSRVVPTRPLSSMKRIHLAMSATLDQTEPAGATGSVVRMGTWRIVSRTSACGVATFGLPMIPATSGSLSVMPRGAKSRVRMKSSHGIPETFATISPPMA